MGEAGGVDRGRPRRPGGRAGRGWMGGAKESELQPGTVALSSVGRVAGERQRERVGVASWNCGPFAGRRGLRRPALEAKGPAAGRKRRSCKLELWAFRAHVRPGRPEVTLPTPRVMASKGKIRLSHLLPGAAPGLHPAGAGPRQRRRPRRHVDPGDCAEPSPARAPVAVWSCCTSAAGLSWRCPARGSNCAWVDPSS